MRINEIEVSSEVTKKVKIDKEKPLLLEAAFLLRYQQGKRNDYRNDYPIAVHYWGRKKGCPTCKPLNGCRIIANALIRFVGVFFARNERLSAILLFKKEY